MKNRNILNEEQRYAMAVNRCFTSLCEEAAVDPGSAEYSKELSVIMAYMRAVIDDIRNVDRENGDNFAIVDKTRGDVSKIPSDPELQTVLGTAFQLVSASKTLPESDKTAVRNYADTITLARSNLASNTGVFIEAYKSNNTVLIYLYRALVMSYIYCAGTVIAEAVEFDENNEMTCRKVIKLSTANVYYEALEKFNKDISTGNFLPKVRNVKAMNEALEASDVSGGTKILHESSILGSVLSAGLRAIQTRLVGNKAVKVGFIIAGALAILQGIREIVKAAMYTKKDLGYVLDSVKTAFDASKAGDGDNKQKGISLFRRFAQVFSGNTDFASAMAKRDSVAQDKTIIAQAYKNVDKEPKIHDIAPENITQILDF